VQYFALTSLTDVTQDKETLVPVLTRMSWDPSSGWAGSGAKSTFKRLFPEEFKKEADRRIAQSNASITTTAPTNAPAGRAAQAGPPRIN
jgi:hypothetical protein